MAIDDTAGFDVTVRTLVGGIIAENVLKYYTDAAAPSQATPADFAEEFLDTIIPPWLTVLSEDATILDFTVDPTIPGGEGYIPYAPHTEVVNGSGVTASQSLPPFVSYRLYKVPDVAEQDPPTPERVWRNGMIRIAGVPESAQNGGLVNIGYTAYLQALGDVLAVVTANLLDHRLYWRRLISGTYYYVPAISVIASPRLGTQNTRKL